MSADGDFTRTVGVVISRLQSQNDRLFTPSWKILYDFRMAARFVELADIARLGQLYGEDDERLSEDMQNEYSDLSKYFTDDANWKKPASDDE